MKYQSAVIEFDKENDTIDFIRQHEPPEGYFLGFSGGKDSTVLYHITKRSGVKFQAYYSCTGIDPPEVVKYIKNYYPDVKIMRPNYKGHRSFFGMIPIKGFPTKYARWCCDILKKDPTKHIPLKHRLMGIRAEESPRREKYGRISETKTYKQIIYSPLYYWVEWQIWDYIEKYNIPYCSLYDEGFSRIGCVICPFICNLKQDALLRHKKRWPKYYKAFEKSMERLWHLREKDRQIEQGYAKTVEEFIDNYYHGNQVKR